MLLMALLTLPVLSIRSQLGWQRLLIVDLPLFSFATLAISGFYLTSQRALYPDWKRQARSARAPQVVLDKRGRIPYL